MTENSHQGSINFQLVPKLFHKDGRFGPYFEISTGGIIRTAAIIGQFMLTDNINKLILKRNNVE